MPPRVQASLGLRGAQQPGDTIQRACAEQLNSEHEQNAESYRTAVAWLEKHSSFRSQPMPAHHISSLLCPGTFNQKWLCTVLEDQQVSRGPLVSLHQWEAEAGRGWVGTWTALLLYSAQDSSHKENCGRTAAIVRLKLMNSCLDISFIPAPQMHH